MILSLQGARAIRNVRGMSAGRAVHHTRNVRVFRRCCRSQVIEELAYYVPTLNDAQRNHENHRDRSRYHVRTDRGSNVYPSDYGKRFTMSLIPQG